MMEFAWPYLFLLLPLPWVFYRFARPYEKNDQAALRVPALDDFECFQKPSALSSSKLKMCVLALMWTALISSAARPQWIGEKVEIPKTGRDLMLAVDLSGSMEVEDFEINGQHVDRLTALKVIASDFIDRREGDRIGLILFGSSAYLQTPLTFDTATVKQLLMESAVGLAGKETAIGDAIGLAVMHLRNSPQESRILILLTDGNNNAGELSPEKAAEIASHANLKVHTVAIGAKEMVINSLFGKRRVNPSADIDEESLKMVAKITGGNFYRAYNTKELAQIYQEIDRLETIERTGQYYRPIDELYWWPLIAALILAIISLWWRI